MYWHNLSVSPQRGASQIAAAYNVYVTLLLPIAIEFRAFGKHIFLQAEKKSNHVRSLPHRNKILIWRTKILSKVKKKKKKKKNRKLTLATLGKTADCTMLPYLHAMVIAFVNDENTNMFLHLQNAATRTKTGGVYSRMAVQLWRKL